MDGTTRSTTIDTGELYESVRHELARLLLEHRERATDDVPACPGWTVHDVLAHVVGLAADLNAQRFPGPDSSAEAWTEAQVRRGSGRSIDDLIAEWDAEGPTFAEGLRLFGYEFGSHFVADLFVHAQDVRQALGVPAHRHELAVVVALDHYMGFLDGLLRESAWGTFTLTTPEDRWIAGAPGRHEVALRAPSFEALRVLAARRSLAQIRRLDWSGDLDDLLDLLSEQLVGSYAFRVTDLEE